MNDTVNQNNFVGYVFEAPSLPSIADQQDAIGNPGTIYVDRGRKAKRRAQLKACVRALGLRGDETLTIATAGVLGSGEMMLTWLNKLAGQRIRLHVADIGQIFDLDSSSVALAELPIAAKKANVARRAAIGGRAASARSGRKSKLSDETKAEALEMYHKRHRSGDWMYSIEDVASRYGVASITIQRNFGKR